jgi:hypothetical protein
MPREMNTLSHKALFIACLIMVCFGKPKEEAAETRQLTRFYYVIVKATEFELDEDALLV